jgi:hypothetical protein
LGGHLILLGSPNPLLGVLALNVGKDLVQRSSEKFACLLDARSCSIAAAILDKRKCRGLRSPCGPIVAGSSLLLSVSLGDALAEDKAKAMAKGSSFPLVSLIGNVLCSRGSCLATVLRRL